MFFFSFFQVFFLVHCINFFFSKSSLISLQCHAVLISSASPLCCSWYLISYGKQKKYRKNWNTRRQNYIPVFNGRNNRISGSFPLHYPHVNFSSKTNLYCGLFSSSPLSKYRVLCLFYVLLRLNA